MTILKKKVKTNVADEKCYANGTGGGPPLKPVQETDIEESVKEILGTRIHGLISEFDGDAAVQLEYEEVEVIEESDLLNSNIDEHISNNRSDEREENLSQSSNTARMQL